MSGLANDFPIRGLFKPRKSRKVARMTLPAIAFIGTGVMGRSMAGHLLAAGHPVSVHTRTTEKAAPLLAAGAHWAATPAGAARAAGIVITMVGYPADVEAVYFGENGIFQTAQPGALLIDMTTSSPALAREIAVRGGAKDLLVLDAPVSGGDVGARNATLSIMVGGGKDAFEKAAPVLALLGKNIVHQGPAGSGQLTKLCNQVAIAGGMLAVCESVAFAKSAGLDPARVLRSIESGAAGSWGLSNLAPRILREDWAPGFFVKHFLKDLRLALEVARAEKLSLPGLGLAERLYARLADIGGADDGTQALFRLYQNNPSNPLA